MAMHQYDHHRPAPDNSRPDGRPRSDIVDLDELCVMAMHKIFPGSQPGFEYPEEDGVFSDVHRDVGLLPPLTDAEAGSSRPRIESAAEILRRLGIRPPAPFRGDAND